ncbi:DUF3349 domain-containing protein [Mycolicibacterium psychrotolerans]|uniref:DUF3349 domain-containing protein n=1 Tax=Mycolicibacterium psychrotolerans TaxID=216929 RepID=UPI0013D1973C
MADSRAHRVLEWLRGGYPAGAPTQGHNPLIALQGPISLSSEQTQRIRARVGTSCDDPVEIRVAITEATGRLPSAVDVIGTCRAIGCSHPHTEA